MDLFVLLLAISLMACGEEATHAGDMFEVEVIPILEARCSAAVCHGIGPDSDALGEQILADGYHFAVDAQGHILDHEDAYAQTRRFINPAAPAQFSDLLRKPAPVVWGGLSHGGGDNLTSPDDAAYLTLLAWIDSETGEPLAPPLNAAERFFGEQVQPLLVGRSCALTNCHGPTSFVPFRLDPGIPNWAGDGIRFSDEMTRANYNAVRPFLALGGDPTQSRLLRKSLPLAAGGIRHRGGNRSFIEGPDDVAYRAIVDWAELERNASWPSDAAGGSLDEPVAGVVFVRGPVAPESPFDLDVFEPGSDLYLRTPAGPLTDSSIEINLTQSLHGGPDQTVDIRDPAVSPEGTHIVFAMRDSEDSGHAIHELELETAQTRQITPDEGTMPSGQLATHRSPVYGPDGFIYFASNRHDVLADRLDASDVDLYRVSRPASADPTPVGVETLERLTFAPGPEIEPAVFNVGPFLGYLVFSYRRAVDWRDETVGFSFPLDRHVDYHIFFGITPTAALFDQFTEMPDGRALVVAGDPDNVWRGGQLAVIDRNLGPDIARASAADPGVVSYADTFAPLDSAAAPSGLSEGGIYRDPVALPDGSILVSWAPGPLELSDAAAEPDFSVVHLTLQEAEPGCITLNCLPSILSREVWIDDETYAVTQPVPVQVRPSIYRSHFELDGADPTLFSMVDVAVNDGVMNNLFPSGSKVFRSDVRYVRFVEAMPVRPADDAVIIDSDGGVLGSSFQLGLHLPSRILGEVELHQDNSLFVQVPANVAFRTQLLDENRMNVGHQHNRWLTVWPGQHFSQSTTPALYDQRCGGCHGSVSGNREDLLQPFDVTTRATVTLARFVDRNPRLPREPLVLGDDSRIEVDFMNQIGPLVEARCLNSGCHNSTDQAGDLSLANAPTAAFSVAYENLLARDISGQPLYVDEASASARTSPIIELLSEREFEAPGHFDAHPELTLTDNELLAFVRWIEVGAPYQLPDERAGDGAER